MKYLSFNVNNKERKPKRIKKKQFITWIKRCLWNLILQANILVIEWKKIAYINWIHQLKTLHFQINLFENDKYFYKSGKNVINDKTSTSSTSQKGEDKMKTKSTKRKKTSIQTRNVERKNNIVECDDDTKFKNIFYDNLKQCDGTKEDIYIYIISK